MFVRVIKPTKMSIIRSVRHAIENKFPMIAVWQQFVASRKINFIALANFRANLFNESTRLDSGKLIG